MKNSFFSMQKYEKTIYYPKSAEICHSVMRGFFGLVARHPEPFQLGFKFAVMAIKGGHG